jgi:DNA-binding LacI/PurR family transcriptional regulator
MGRKAVTIRDVAQRAGVGVSTVSYVLNGRDDHVSTTTRELILAAARELNYRPNQIARSMVRKKTATIGLIITEVQNPLFAPITEGVEAVLRLEGYHIILASAGDPDSEVSAVETLRAQQVDGLIFMSLSLRFPTGHLRKLHEEEFPFVVINRDLDDSSINLIQFDDRGAGRMATEHLIALGHTRIGTISGPMSTDPLLRRRSTFDRYEGWREALAAHHLQAPSDLVADGGYTYAGGYCAVQQLLEQSARSSERPTALFVANDMMAVGVLKALYEAGVRVPQDMAVVAIGDPPFAAYTIPALTTLVMPIVEAGQVAARLLIDWLSAGKPAQAQHITLKFALQIRESCGAGLHNDG